MSAPVGPDDGSGLGALDRLVRLLDLERIERDVFRGFSPPVSRMRVFGGQVAAQALVAATRTVSDRAVHSLHAYFLRPGDPSRPIVYEVDRIRDGRSYTTRRVVGIQGGRAIFNLQASFHGQEDGYEHQVPAPAGVPPPEEVARVEPRAGDATDFGTGDRPIDARPVPGDGTAGRRVWFRADGRLGDDPTLHRCVAAYVSDLTLITVALVPHGFPEVSPSFLASLDHAMWFHRPFRADEWMLYDQVSPSAGSGRGLALGHIFTRAGELAVTVVQEGAVRP